MALPAMASLAAMLLGLVRDCICLRRLLEDVGDGEAPNAVINSDSFRGVELPPAMGRKLFGGDFASMETRKTRREKRLRCQRPERWQSQAAFIQRMPLTCDT